MEKYEFIQMMLQHRRLSVNDKKRLLLLATKEIERNQDTSRSSSESKQESNDSSKKDDSTKHRSGVHVRGYISPKNNQEFLKEFNQDDILKYTCHLIDAEEVIENICRECSTDQYDYAKHVELIQSRFTSLKGRFLKKNIMLSEKLIALMNVYLTGVSGRKKSQNEWSSNKIKENWNYEPILQWAIEHPHIISAPGKNIAKKQKNMGYVLPKAFISNVTGTRIKTFSDLVIFFKSQFHIRQDNSLRSILCKVNKEWKPEDICISFADGNFNNGIEIFTDVDKLIQAYQNIIKLCIECRREKNEPVQIELGLSDNSDTNEVIFSIHHINNKYNKTSKGAVERIGESQSLLISNQINGLCDLYIEAEFGDGVCGTVNLWNEEKELYFTPSDTKIKGVKYILKF